MKSRVKTKILILLYLVLVFTLFPIVATNFSLILSNNNKSLDYRNQINSDNNNPKIAKISERIHIDGNSGWAAFKAAGNCTGSGNYTHPYIIEDLVIDAGGPASGIYIQDSDVFFIIENCTIYNSLYSVGGGIELYYVKNSQLINNNCSSNYIGIRLYDCENNTVSGNTLDNNEYGIHLMHSEDNFILGNFVSNPKVIPQGWVIRGQQGIYFYYSFNNTFSGNIMNGCGFEIGDTIVSLSSNEIDATNLVNGKSLYYYTNEVNLGTDNFTNGGQVILVNCNDSLISNLNTSYCNKGISLYYCNDNILTQNIANYDFMGIYLLESDNNKISEHNANSSYYGIHLDKSDFNTILGNNVTYGFIGVYILNSNNSIISDNNLNFNYIGIRLFNCDFNFISGNTAHNNNHGIELWYSHNNIISKNIAINNGGGISLIDSYENIISGNNASYNTHGITLGKSNFNLISNNTANNNIIDGIFLYESDSNIISQNTANYHSYYGIYLGYSDNNIISGNTLMYNEYCFKEKNCKNNQFSNNILLCYKDRRFVFVVILVTSILGGVVVLGIAITLLIKYKRKRKINT